MSGTQEPLTGEQPIANIDPTRASIARVYDAFLGGKDNFESDRIVFERIRELSPEVAHSAQEHRKWLGRVVRFLAGEAEIDQFLDCGSGLPTVENTHQIAQRVNPEATVVYVDNDPAVLAYGRALLEENDRTHFVGADLTHPAELLGHPDVGRHLDLKRPIGLIHCGTFHHIDDEDDPWAIMAAYVDAVASGSYLAITHFHDPDDGSRYSQLAKTVEDRFRTSTMGTGRFRTHAEIERLFTGLELVDPGVALTVDWWPEGPRLEPMPDFDHLVLGGVGRKP